MDRDWAEAVKVGEKNQRTATLAQNWCAHARIENHGGVGLIQVQTGLPIGPHAMACDYATSGSTFAAWDLVDAVVNFYDKNCAICSYRQPVRLPNLLDLVGERDAALRAREAKAAAQSLEQADGLRQRRAVREALRAKLPPPSQSLVDRLDGLDTGAERRASEELEAAAELAPEAFTPDLVDHLLSLVECNQHWAMETALVLLDKLGAAPDRLASGALRSVSQRGGVKSAEVLLRHVAHARKSQVAYAVPMLIQLAEPADFFLTGDKGRAAPQYLVAVHKAFSEQVEGVINDLLGSTDLNRLSSGARAICVLGAGSDGLALKFARTVVAKLVQTDWEGRASSQRSTVRAELRRAAALAFRADPKATEQLIEALRIGTTPQGHKELLAIYQWVLRRGWEETKKPLDTADQAAFDRMIALASNPPNMEIVPELGGVFAHAGSRLKALATDKIDALLGAAALLADVLERLDGQHNAAPTTDFVTKLERSNHRLGLASLQGNLVEVAAAAAADDPERTQKFLSLLGSVPPERVGLRHALVEHLNVLITSPATLAAVLPYLYSALVGAGTAEHAAAARTVGKIRRKLLEDAPSLLLEAFVALLSDQYLYPVTEALEALERVRLPDAMAKAVGSHLWLMIGAYAKTADQQAFLIQTIDTVTARFLSADELAGKAGVFIVGVLEPHDVLHYYSELRHLAWRFKRQPAFGRLVIKSLRDPNYRNLDGTIELLSDLPARTIAANATALEALVSELSLERTEWRLGQVLVEALARAAQWDAALRTLDLMFTEIVDVPRNRRRRLHLATVKAAVDVERAVAQGRLGDVAALAKAWREASQRDQDEAYRGS